MKKILIALVMLSAGMPGTCGFGDPGFSNLHYLQTLQQQEFRMEEYNDFKDFEQQKQDRLKKDEEYVHGQQTPPAQTNTEAKFINDNGQIKIEY
jgi:hypothetical protein